MADLALSALQTLFAALQNPQLLEICSIWGYKSQVKDLEETVSTIRKLLIDAEAKKHKLSDEEKHYVMKLKDVVYEADDLFDKVLTLAKVKLHGKGDKLSKKVRDFFSAYTVSQEVKKIRKKLDTISSNHTKFGLKIDSEPIRRRREETCSYVYAPHVIGRVDDVKAVVDRLLDPNVVDDVSCLPIVGVGGLGKTTLAQLVYHDDRVREEFPLRLWVCVSDQDGKEFDVKANLSKILESAGHKLDDGSSMERVQNQFQERLGGKKYFLVLDDVWNEDCYQWRELKAFLMRFGRGSRIMATTRSKETARVIGNGDTHTYELGGLSKENSWLLFVLAAFGDQREHAIPAELVEIGRNIVEQCSNVPLAIKVAGSLLFGQDKSKWQAFLETGLAKTSEGGNKIMSILKLSYDNLESQLKSCFSYCALFPKDYEIQKEMLISLWMAQGYIKPFIKGQKTEDAGNDYFSILMRRCFFQDVKMDEYGDVESCKIHDLMHDVAQQVAGVEMFVTRSINNNWDDKVRHIFWGKWDSKIPCHFNESNIRTCLHGDYNNLWSLIRNWGCLRTLELENNHYTDTEQRLPDSIGKLMHMRYLSLSEWKNLKALPKSITKLHNLQTLILKGCNDLVELPNDLSKLVNLRHLDIKDCSNLTYMPAGLGGLTCLAVLTDFKVANTSPSSNRGELKDLKALKNLKGHIEIWIARDYNCKNIIKNEQEGGYLVSLEHLKSITIIFTEDGYDEKIVEDHQALLENLQPHPNVRRLNLRHYGCTTIPRWGRAEDDWATILPNLVHIKLWGCAGLQYLPSLSKLQSLKSLTVSHLKNLEYIEDTSCRGSSDATSEDAVSTFFPSLEFLHLEDLPKLEGFGGRDDLQLVGDSCSSSSRQLWFPRLSKLVIFDCPNLVSFPPFPSVDKIFLSCLNAKLRIKTTSSDLKLKEVTIGDVVELRALPPCHPTTICIANNEDVESFSGGGDVFNIYGSSTVRCLEISDCYKLKSLSGGGFQHLTALDSLCISYCPNLILNDDDNGDGIPWRSLHRTLRSLDLEDLSDMETLPSWMQYLTSLQHLTIFSWTNLKEIPEWISCLSSLKSLDIFLCKNIKSLPDAIQNLSSLHRLVMHDCSDELQERCRKPDGEDWPKIKHIPEISIRKWR